MKMYQVVETCGGVTRVKMVDCYKKCLARAKQLKDSKREYHNYKCEVVECSSNVKFNTRTPGMWNERKFPKRS